MEEDYNKREPEKFTQFLRRQRSSFLSHFWLCVCLLGTQQFQTNVKHYYGPKRLGQGSNCDLVIVFDRFLWFSKILYGGLRGSC